MATASTASLVDVLRQYRILEPVLLEEVTRTLQGRFLDPKALARELMQREWLTPYQANQLLQGKGPELVLGSYLLLERLGQGGMGQVFKARHRNLGRIVAVKLIRKERLDSLAAVKRFQREVRAAAALAHPNIVHAYDADEIRGTHLLVMEYIEGAIDLARLVKNKGPLPVEQACEFIRQTALGLQHACERGLVHRDIKPHNLLLTADGQTVKILDMGLARLDHQQEEDDASSTVTQEGAVMGTPDYIAPEQALESHTVDIRADLYSLGCTGYYLLTGRVPFPGGTFIQKINKHQFENPQPVEELRPDVPPEAAGVVRRLMAKKPEERYQTPAEAAAALESVLSRGSGVSPATKADDRTMAEHAPVVASATGETFPSVFAEMATYEATAAADAPRRLRRKAEEQRWLLFSAAGGCLLLIGAVVLGTLLFKEPAGKKISAQEEDRPVGEQPPPKKTAVKVEDGWLKQVAVMSPDKQVQAVAKKLKELNPGFDGKVTHRADLDGVTALEFVTDHVTDISPVRALKGLQELKCPGSKYGKGKLSDLAPLKGMKLTSLQCYWTDVADLSPLKGMPLKFLECGAKVSDLSPLQGMPLTLLNCNSTQVSDLAPLKGMPLKALSFHWTKVSDLSPLKGMKLTGLDCNHTKVSDLAPLKGMKLNYLSCLGTKVSDLSPLKRMPLNLLCCDFKPERDSEILRSIKTLEKINDKPVKDFWKEVKAKQAEKKP